MDSHYSKPRGPELPVGQPAGSTQPSLTQQNIEDLYRDLAEHCQDLLCTHDLHGRLLSINPGPARVLGYSAEEFLQIPMREHVAPEFREEFDEYLKRIQRDGVAKGLLAVVTRTGERRIWEYYNTLRTEGVAEPIVRGIAHDVTELKRAEKALREAAEQSRQVISSVGEGIILFDVNLHYLMWNRFMENLTGLPAQEVLGRPLLEVFPEAKKLGIYDLLQRALQGEYVDVPDFCYRQPRANGQLKWISGRHSPMRNTQGEVVGVIVAVDDVTERRQSEEALRQSEERFRVALQGSPIVVFNQDRDLRYTWMYNPRLVSPLLQDCVGKSHADLFLPDEAARLTEIKRRVLETGTGTRELVELTAHGKKQYYDLTVEALRDTGGQVAGVTCAATNITELHEKTDQLQMLLEISQVLASQRDWSELFGTISSCLHSVFKQDIAAISLYDAEKNTLRVHVLRGDKGGPAVDKGTELPVNESIQSRVIATHETVVFRRAELESMPHFFARLTLKEGGQTVACAPLQTRKGLLGTIMLASKQEDAFGPAEIDLLETIAGMVAIALDNARAYGEIAQLNEKLEEEKLYLEKEIQTELHFEEIIGESPALKQSFGQARLVSSSDASVLLLGETGTGKELIARSIHRMSPRRDKNFIKLNCAAIPSGLLESELFGHEKGAFTGAISQKVGRLELADHGTLFLDEIGESRWRSSPSCCACCKITNLSGWAGPARCTWMCG